MVINPKDLSKCTYEIFRKFNVKNLIEAAYNTGLVASVIERYRYIYVYFTTGVLERWDLIGSITYFSHKIPFDPLAGGLVPIRTTIDPLNKNTDFIIHRRDWYKGSFLEQRISIQKIIKIMMEDGFSNLVQPHDILVKDLQSLREKDLIKRHIHNYSICLYGQYGTNIPGKHIINSLTPWVETIKEYLLNPRKIHYAAVQLTRYRRAITKHNIMNILNSRKNAGNFINPNVYRTIIKMFGLGNKVIADPAPNFGSKAIAATMEGCSYYCPNKHRLSQLSNFLGTEFGELDNSSHYDVVLLDYDFYPKEDIIEILDYWEGRADFKIVYVSKEDRHKLPKPVQYFKFQKHYQRKKEPDYVYYYA